MNKFMSKLQDIVPIIAFVVVLLFFTVKSDGRMLSAFNISLLIEQSIIIVLIGCGMLFVVAQGSIDLSVGVNLAFSGVISMWASEQLESPYLMIPIAIIVGLLVGILNGVIVAKLKVPSFMLTLAMLIGLRGIVHKIQFKINVSYLSPDLYWLNKPVFEDVERLQFLTYKMIVFIVILAIMYYVFEFTRVGRNSQAIGENEIVAKYVGIRVDIMKIAAFGLSGMMSGCAALFSILNVGGTSQTMGSFTEMKVAMAIFLGGVLVTGGVTARMYKVILGSFTITIIVNGLALISLSQTEVSQSVEGVLLLLILFATIIANQRNARRITPLDDDPEENALTGSAEGNGAVVKV
ncbi:MAG: ABC transporter permease [Clostridiales Family XIII bacterium]|jgi:ribose transport system permease protein|nr:ABC transporter permease [Clostridiales Family XIII bacterium]